jgi:hypothetical protein
MPGLQGMASGQPESMRDCSSSDGRLELALASGRRLERPAFHAENRRTGRWSATGWELRRSEGYFADFNAVRRQRVQTIAFTVVPFLVSGNG